MKKINIVTGGTSGLGLCMARCLVKQGKNVVIIGRQFEKLKNALDELQGIDEGVIVEGQALDISREMEVNSFYESLIKKYEIECLFNVTGVGRFGKAIDICEEEIDQVLDANLKGLVLMTVAALKTMTSYGGKIANIMSTASLKGKAGESVYCASKWGAKGFTEALKSEYKGSNILIYGVYPGGMKTSFWNETSLVKTDGFMEPEAVAEHIVDAVMNETIYISEIVIERK